LTYADLAASDQWAAASSKAISSDASVTPVKEWKVLGTPVSRNNGRKIVTASHKFPSDISRPGMFYGKILRAPSYGAKLASIDLAPAKDMKDVVVVRDDDFLGVAAKTSFLAEQAIAALAKTAKWDSLPHPSSKDLFNYLKEHAQGGIPENPFS